MKALTNEWVIKAEGDFNTAQREMSAKESPNYDAACFHAQQCAEKYLKARLCQAGIAFGRTHDLVAMLDQAIEVEPALGLFREDLAYMSAFAVEFRYPGESADRETAIDARRRCRRFRLAARNALALPPE